MEGRIELIAEIIRKLAPLFWLVLALIVLAFLADCGTRYDDNPRNTRNMTATEIERALTERK